jgi:hypothetical protein
MFYSAPSAFPQGQFVGAPAIGPVFGAGLGTARMPSASAPRGFEDRGSSNFSGGVSLMLRRFVAIAAADSSYARRTIPADPIFVFDPSIQSGCRNRINGQLVSTASCQSTSSSQWSGKLLGDLNLLLDPLPLMVGAGYHLGDSRSTSGMYFAGGYAKRLPKINGLIFTRALAGKSVARFQMGVAVYLTGDKSN